MAVLPSRYSAWWLFVVLILASVLASGFVAMGIRNSGEAPDPGVLLSIVGVCSALALVSSLLGFLGARMAFVGATVGMLIGLGLMLYVAWTGSREGMRDLAALLSFLMYGVIGAVVGLVIDGVQWLARRRRAA